MRKYGGGDQRAHHTEQALWMRARDVRWPTLTRSGCGSLSRRRDCRVEGPRGAKLAWGCVGELGGEDDGTEP